MPPQSRLGRLLGLHEREENVRRTRMGDARRKALDALDETERKIQSLRDQNFRPATTSSAELAAIGLSRRVTDHAIEAAKAHELHLVAVADAAEADWRAASQELESVQRLVDRHDLHVARARRRRDELDVQDMVASRDTAAGDEGGEVR